jgi:hypothetical protein
MMVEFSGSLGAAIQLLPKRFYTTKTQLGHRPDQSHRPGLVATGSAVSGGKRLKAALETLRPARSSSHTLETRAGVNVALEGLGFSRQRLPTRRCMVADEGESALGP